MNQPKVKSFDVDLVLVAQVNALVAATANAMALAGIIEDVTAYEARLHRALEANCKLKAETADQLAGAKLLTND